MKNELSVVIPAYNEEQQIDATVESVVAYFRKNRYAFEVLIVNDGSVDSTLERAKKAAMRHSEVRVIDLGKNQGKGQAVKEGVAHARFDHCLFMDADNATKVEEWEKFVPFFDSGARVVVASRRLPASRIVHAQPPVRRVLGGLYRGLSRSLFGLDASDFNCGFKAYETKLAKDIYARVQMTGWAFDTEVFCLLKRNEIKVEEVPVAWEHRDKRSSLPPFKAGFDTLGSLWRMKRIYR